MRKEDDERMEGQAIRPPGQRLQVRRLRYSVGKNTILSDVSIDVANDESIGILGRDGSGKTSLFQLLAGLTAPDSGSILLNGTDITDQTADERARLGLCYLPEETSIFQGLSAEENIALALDVLEPDPAARAQRLELLLRDFHLLHVRSQVADSLSGGERRRCELARTMAGHPSILMLDEPFRGLDPMSVREVARTVAAMRHQGVGVVISDYDLHDLVGLIDRAYVLHDGQVIFSGSQAELLEDPAVRHLYLGESFTL